MRDGVPECHVVQLDRLESCLDRPSRREDPSPVPARLTRVQIARFHHMPVPPHDDAAAGQSAAPLQAHFGDLTGGHANPEAVVTLAERGVHRAAPCRPSALSSPLATLAPPRPLLNQSSGRKTGGHDFRAGRPTPSCAPTVATATCGPAMSVAMRRRKSPSTSSRSAWSCSCPVCWKQAAFVSAWLAGSRQLSARRLDRRPRHCATQYGTTRHEAPCDRRHTDVLTKILTKRLGKAWRSCRIRRSPAVQHGGPTTELW